VFALTIDQVDSRGRGDRVGTALADIADRWGDDLRLGPDRTAGDEFQILVNDARTALALVLDLTRDGDWSVGLGVGAVVEPLPPTTREAVGPALVAARDAVDRAKRAAHRFALGTPDDRCADGADAEALVELLLELRGRRSPEGWVVADRMLGGATQAAIAGELGITPQAVSLRARAAAVRAEIRALPALARALARLDGPRS